MANPPDSNFTKEIQTALQNNDQALAAEKIKDYLEKEKNIPLNIAITGESGAGKSTFVNAMRGIDNKHEDAAPTGCVETTMVATSYDHPNYPNVKLWDLPGVGTTKFSADKYLKDVGFEKFDFFIIISESRFTENDVKLAEGIKKIRKKFYFVRSKIDHNLHDAEKSEKDFDAEKTLARIRENCTEGLKQKGVESQVFLVSSFDLPLYDFPLLHETLERELPAHKKDVLLLALPNISLQIINKKKEAFQVQITWHAFASAAVAAVPVPGLSIAVDAALFVSVVRGYISGFGLDKPSLQRLADRTKMPLNDILAVIKSPLTAQKITNELLLKLLVQSAGTAAIMAAEEGLRLIPIFGAMVAASLSFLVIERGLNSFLNMLCEDAQRVFEKVLRLSTSV